MRAASRPIRLGITWCSRYAATASSRPLSVASPSPKTPARVSILSVTKLRPGQVTMTRAAVISPAYGLDMNNNSNREAIGALPPDRLFPADPGTRAVARRLYNTVRALPIISPHGHTDPRWFADNAAFGDPVSLLL